MILIFKIFIIIIFGLQTQARNPIFYCQEQSVGIIACYVQMVSMNLDHLGKMKTDCCPHCRPQTQHLMITHFSLHYKRIHQNEYYILHFKRRKPESQKDRWL